MAYPKTILIGDRVRWQSPDGTIRGEVVNIFDALGSNGDITTWFQIEYHNGIALINETEIIDLELIVTFRDLEVQIAHSEKID